MLVIYQIGDVPIFDTIVGIDSKGVGIDLGRKWRFPTTTFSGIGGSTSYLPLMRSLSETPDIKFNGELRATAPYSITRTMNALKSLGGRRNIPLIGFFLENPMLERDSLSNLLWLYTNVTITDVDDKFDYSSSSDGWAFDHQSVSISMKAGLSWRALSPWFWEYRDPFDYIINPLGQNAQVGVDNYFHHPRKFTDLAECYYFYKWQSNLSNYNTTFWGLKYDDGLLGGYGLDFSDFGTFQFYSDPQIWSADPSSIYAFTNLLPTGSISISVQRASGLFANEGTTEVSSLDLGQLDADMALAGYSGLQPDDIVFTGALSPFPGFVQRDGERLLNFSPKWDYPGTYPGETGRGFNTFTVSSIDTVGQVAFLHDYGVL